MSTQQGSALITTALTFPLSLALNIQVLLSHLSGQEWLLTWPHTASTWDTSLEPKGQLGSCAGDATSPARTLLHPFLLPLAFSTLQPP